MSFVFLKALYIIPLTVHHFVFWFLTQCPCAAHFSPFVRLLYSLSYLFAVYCLFCITLSCVLCVPQWSIWVFLHQHFTLVSSIIFTVLHLFWWLFVVILCLCSHFWCFYGSFVPLWAFFVCVSATSICLCCEPRCLLLTWRQMKDCEQRLTTVWSVWSFCSFSPDWHTRLSQ